MINDNTICALTILYKFQVLGYGTNHVLRHQEVAVPSFALEKINLNVSDLLKQQSAVVPVKAPVVPLLGFWLAENKHRWWYQIGRASCRERVCLYV